MLNDISRYYLMWLSLLSLSVTIMSCYNSDPIMPGRTAQNEPKCGDNGYQYQRLEGCDGQVYPDPLFSPYIIPFTNGTVFRMGLSNCSASFHAPGSPHQYAFDFDFPVGHEFIAARGGTVVKVEEGSSDNMINNGVGNYLVIDHGDGTFGWYLHSPQDGIYVESGDRVNRRDVLGVVGQTGSAGYPHLHFIVTRGENIDDFNGIPITFGGFSPMVTLLRTGSQYIVCN